MKLRFEVTMDHIMAFARYHYSHSPTLRRSRRFHQWSIGTFLFLVFSLLWLLEDPPVVSILIWYSVSAAYILFVRYNHRRSYLRHMKKMYREGENKSIMGEHVMTIEDFGILDRTEGGESRTFWSSIVSIASTDDCTFAYSGSVAAHVIPSDSVTEGDYGSFVEYLKQQHEKNTATSSAT